MHRILTVLFILLAATATSCRGHRGHSGPAGAAGVDGGSGLDGANGVDGANGADGEDATAMVFDYFRGAKNVTIADGYLIVAADEVIPQQVLDFAPILSPDANKPTYSFGTGDDEGLQLVLGVDDSPVRYVLLNVPAGDREVWHCDENGWTKMKTITFAKPGFLAIMPLNSVSTLAVDPSVLEKGFLWDLGTGNSEKLTITAAARIGHDIEIR